MADLTKNEFRRALLVAPQRTALDGHLLVDLAFVRPEIYVEETWWPLSEIIAGYLPTKRRS